MPAKKKVDAAVAEVKEAKTTKKTTTKAAKAKELVPNVEIQFDGKNTAVNALVEAVKAAYKAEGNEDAIETLDIYVQPQNGVAFYVVNGKSEGKCVSL